MHGLPKFSSEQGLEFQLNLKKQVTNQSHQWFNEVKEVRMDPLVIPDIAKASTEIYVIVNKEQIVFPYKFMYEFCVQREFIFKK